MARARKAARPRHTSGNALIGRLVAAILASWLVYVVVDRFTLAPDAVALWLSGAAAALMLSLRTRRS